MSEIQTPTVVEESRVYDIPAYRLPLVEDKISKANRRLERAGVAERFSFSTEEYLAKKKVGGTELPDGTIIGGTEIEVPRLKVSLDRFDLAVGDFTFVASLVPEEAGITVHVAPGQSLDGWRPTEFNVCEHCHTHRNRNRVYVVRNNATGELTQVGHTCVELYTGLSIKGLWSLEFDLDEFGGAEEDDDWGGGGFGRTEYSAPVDKVLAYAYVLSDQGRSYASTRVREWGTPTVDLVRHAMFDRIRPPQGRPGSRGYAEARAAYEKLVDDIKTAEKLYADGDPIIAAIKASAETLKSGSDYADNMAVILAGENVSRRNVGILASLVAVYARERQLAVERAARPKPVAGFLGEVKQRIRNLTIELTNVRFFDGNYGTTTLLIGITPDGHLTKWFATGCHDYEVGDRLTLDATVKAHEQYRGADQTTITRGSVKSVVKA